jgi:hypothetical protein
LLHKFIRIGRKCIRRATFGIVFFATTLSASAICAGETASHFDPKPWLADLEQTRQAFAIKYANLEWAVFEREIDLNALFGDTRMRIANARDNEQARAAFDRLARRIGDGHVEFRWPEAGAESSRAENADRCGALGYDPAMNGDPVAALAPGYRPLPAPDEFPSGLLAVGGRTVGVIKIGLFMPRGAPALCRAALRALAVDPKKPCDDSCSDRVDMWATVRMTRDLTKVLGTIDAAGAEALVVDIAGNGGGSEWAEAAARMMTPMRLTSERMDFMRGRHWADSLAHDISDMRSAAEHADAADRALLLKLASDANAKRKVALTPCDSVPLWVGKHLSCAWLGAGLYGSGMLASADPAWLAGKAWAPIVFSPAQYPYTEGAWRKPVIILVNRGTGSAASEFAAVLQDNHAAIVMGSPALGGCGHTNGGTPTTLANSKGVLGLPDCARLRADGSNEVQGIEPDVLVGFTPGDGPRTLGKRFLAQLPDALARAFALERRHAGAGH